MKQLTFDQMNRGVLPDGTEIKEGDIVKYDMPTGIGFTRVVLIEGNLCMKDNYLYGKGCPISHYLNEAGYHEIEKVKLIDVYRFCKENDWSFSYTLNSLNEV